MTGMSEKKNSNRVTLVDRNSAVTLFIKQLWCGLTLLTLTACPSTAPVYGIRPVYPPPKPGLFQMVDSLQPTLRWEPFKYVAKKGQETEVHSQIDNITYDMRIWRLQKGRTWYWKQGERHGDPGVLVYSRENLPDSWHTIETPLDRSKVYFWSIRTKFTVDGHLRVTEWAEQLYMIGVHPKTRYFSFQTPFLTP